MTRAVTLIAALLIFAPAAHANVQIDGHGWGHGVGMSQYGAMGYAQQEGRDFRWILGHYYPGTQVTPTATSRIRVRLKEAPALRIQSVAKAGTKHLNPGLTYRFSQWHGQIRIVDSHGHAVAHVPAPLRVSAGKQPLRLVGKAENGVNGGRYRGALTLSLDGTKVLAVNDVALEDYLLGVVAGEMPASWPAEALKTQAVAARTYALKHRSTNAAFDVYADTRSQVYGGIKTETPQSTAAVQATKKLVVLFNGQLADTLFFSSSGGKTAAAEEVFQGSQPVPYLVSVDDPYDTASPFHDWSVTLSNADVQQKLGLLSPGALMGIVVSVTTPTGRAKTVHITGALGAVDAPADQVESLLGLRSTWYTITFTA